MHPNYKDINLKAEKNFTRSTFKLQQQLVKLRDDHTFKYGSYRSKAYNDNVFAYSRTLKGHSTYVVIMNIGGREETIDVTELADDFSDVSQVVLAGVDTFYSPG